MGNNVRNWFGTSLIAIQGLPDNNKGELNLQSQPQSGKDDNTSIAGNTAKSTMEASRIGSTGKSVADSESIDSEDRNDGWSKVGGSHSKKDGNAKKT